MHVKWLMLNKLSEHVRNEKNMQKASPFKLVFSSNYSGATGYPGGNKMTPTSHDLQKSV